MVRRPLGERSDCPQVTALNLIEFELDAAFRARVLATHEKRGVVDAAFKGNSDQVIASSCSSNAATAWC